MDLTWPEVVDATLKHVEESLTQFRGRIKYWDVINEAHDWANAFNLTQEQNVELAVLACARAREIDPDAKLIVNSSLVFAEYAANHEVSSGPLFDKLKTPLQYLEDIIEAGADFDIVGLQLYFPARDLTAIDRLIRVFEKLGKPIHITKLGVPAGTGRGEEYPMASRDVLPQIGLARGRWRAPWSEQVQADWLERFYVQMLACESVEAISWWDMQDPGFMKTSPFLLMDGSPRSIFYRLREIRRAYTR